MAEDKFERSVKAGAIAVAKAVPGAALITNFVQGYAKNKDDTWRDVLQQELLADVEKLKERVADLEDELRRSGKNLDLGDELGALQVAEALLRQLANAETGEKRDALINAVAHQFDPRFGEPAMRRYLLGEINDIGPSFLHALKIVGRFGTLLFADDGVYRLTDDEKQKIESLSDAEATTLEAVLKSEAPGSGLVDYTGLTFSVTKLGRLVLTMIADPPRHRDGAPPDPDRLRG